MSIEITTDLNNRHNLEDLDLSKSNKVYLKNSSNTSINILNISIKSSINNTTIKFNIDSDTTTYDSIAIKDILLHPNTNMTLTLLPVIDNNSFKIKNALMIEIEYV